MWGRPLTAHLEALLKVGGGQFGQESGIPGVSESDTGRQNRPPPGCSAGKCWTHSGFVKSLARTCQGRTWGEGQMISVSGTNKRMKSEREDSLAEEKEEVSWL